MRLVGSILRILSARLRRQALRLQSQMDIHPESLWHNPEFVRSTGGFLPCPDSGERSIEDGSPWDSVRRDMLVLLMRDIEMRGVQGALAEVGVYRGETARIIHHYLPDRTLHLFDTFAGFDQRDIDGESEATGAGVPEGLFGDTSLEGVRQRVGPRNANVEFHPGRFPDSFPESLREGPFAFVHLDADLYEPTKAGLEVFYPLMSPGGYVVVHDYNAWPGARRATDEYFANRTVVPVPMPDKNGSAVIAKPGP